jgi:outer membrane lipoprotein-sorting protein
MRALVFLCCAVPAMAGAPAWWSQLLKGRMLSADFVQESESAVFGKVARKGRLQIAPGSKLRVAYVGGLLLVSDGHRIVQYDPDTRSAQRMELKRAMREAPMLALLVDPADLGKYYAITFQGETVKLAPKAKDLPAVEAEGKGAFPLSFRWTDPTGAAQELHLSNPSAAAVDAATFRFVAPAGTRWSD